MIQNAGSSSADSAAGSGPGSFQNDTRFVRIAVRFLSSHGAVARQPHEAANTRATQTSAQSDYPMSRDQ